MGVYGVTHLAVWRRTREIGIRMALGANVSGIVTMVVRRSATLAVAGIVLGLALAAAVSRALQALLFRASALDPFILGGAATVMIATALAAARIPASRAAGVHPASVLKAD